MGRRAARRRLRAIAEHCCVAPRSAAQSAPAEAASSPLADLDVDGLVASYRRDGYVVVRSFLRADELRRYREELQAYIADVVPTKRTDEVFFDGEASVEGGRGSLDELKYINHLHERPFFAAFSAEQSAAAHPRWCEPTARSLPLSPVYSPAEGRRRWGAGTRSRRR